MLTLSIKAQRALLWISVGMLVAFGAVFALLYKIPPLMSPTLTAEEVAAFYKENSLAIRLGGVVTSWVTGFSVALTVVISAQIARLEKGWPGWATLQVVSGSLNSIFIVLPSMLWAVAAFSPDRPPEVTLAIHEFANLMVITAGQFFIFQFVAIVVVCLAGAQDELSPFRRWYGYLTIWTGLTFEVAAFAFMTHTGPFAWNGLFSFLIPMACYFAWLVSTIILLFMALNRQQTAASAAGTAGK